MFACRHSILVNVLVENDVGLGLEWVRNLTPEERDRASNLYEGAQHRLVTLETTRNTVYNLLNFDPIGDITLVIDSSTQIPSACEVAITPCDNHDGELVAAIDEILLVDVAVNHWHNPLFALYGGVEVAHKEVVPHHLIVPRFEVFYSVVVILVRGVGSVMQAGGLAL